MKNLLITLGCSLIEGDGAYNQNNLDKYMKGDISLSSLQTNHQNGFLKYGIGHNLQKLLNYSDLINVGIGSSSIEYQMDVLFRLVDLAKIKKEYNNITIFLLLSYPNRYNKYVNDSSITYSLEEKAHYFNDEYNQLPENIYKDAVMDQIKYVNILNQISNSHNWNLIWGCVDTLQHNIIIKHKLTKYLDNLISPINKNHSLIDVSYLRKNNMVSYDLHPNRSGYEFIFNNIKDWIIKYKSNIIAKNFNTLEDINVEKYSISGIRRYYDGNTVTHYLKSFYVDDNRNEIFTSNIIHPT